ncbi:hypothetical protein PORY_001958 [Pneumocystis oryctolagi]|uniref:Uncharacterized protein n=1 Tax=Pneumocystis oryctolagi TaxID=42067 RepID=A0ACB7CAQ8_9ASCO|nr:hypothetical protein PORY_001958 [Pneumocystis oryctolagi]
MSQYQNSNEKLNKEEQIKRTLREFYKLDTPTQFVTQLPNLDEDDFDIEQYEKDAMNSDPQTLLNIENTLIQEIRSLESEKKMLVYDNYTKLLSVANTMKTNSEPMKSVITMLEPTLAHIGTLSTSLNQSLIKKETKDI